MPPLSCVYSVCCCSVTVFITQLKYRFSCDVTGNTVSCKGSVMCVCLLSRFSVLLETVRVGVGGRRPRVLSSRNTTTCQGCWVFPKPKHLCSFSVTESLCKSEKEFASKWFIKVLLPEVASNSCFFFFFTLLPSSVCTCLCLH